MERRRDERISGRLKDRTESDRIHLSVGRDHEGGDPRDEGALDEAKDKETDKQTSQSSTRGRRDSQPWKSRK
jgi:hypothetical protein